MEICRLPSLTEKDRDLLNRYLAPTNVYARIQHAHSSLPERTPQGPANP